MPSGDAHSVSEQDVIAAVAALQFADDPQVEVGIGDDCAVIRPTAATGVRQLATTDLLIEGVHFDLRYMKLEDVGWKALAVNISDIAAMGGMSRLALGQLGVPRGTAAEDVQRLLAGVSQCAAEYGVRLIGGDTVAAPQWTVGFTLLGECTTPPVLRSGAQPSDQLWLAGLPGLSQVGLHLLWGKAQGHEQLGRTPYYLRARDAHRHPQPKVEAGRQLAQFRATAAIDTSDSLAQCALQLAAASSVGLALDFRAHVFPPQVTAFAAACRKLAGVATESGPFAVPGEYTPEARTLQYATLAQFTLASAEDYGLLFTAPAEQEPMLRTSNLALQLLGTIVAADQGCHYLDETGDTHELTPLGWQHL